MIQPLVVEKLGSGYLLHAGERRLRAARMAGLETVPVVLTSETQPKERALRAIVENIHRTDMHAVETARAYLALKERHGMTIHEIAEQAGDTYTNVIVRLRLASLPEEIQNLMLAGRLPWSQKPVAAFASLRPEHAVALAKRLVERSKADTVPIARIEKAVEKVKTQIYEQQIKIERKEQALKAKAENKKAGFTGLTVFDFAKVSSERVDNKTRAAMMRACVECDVLNRSASWCVACPLQDMLKIYVGAK